MIPLGILFIWYKRKATLSSATMVNLVKLIPSLADNTPSFDSLLPMLSELAPSRTNTGITPATESHQTTSSKLLASPVLTSKTPMAPSSLPTTQPSTQHLEKQTNRN